MNASEALGIVRSLASGVDPVTGDAFPEESAYQRPQIVRALYEAVAALERSARFSRRKEGLPGKASQPWTEEEDRRLLAAFDAGRALAEVAAEHQRTQGAIRARLAKYGRLAA